MKSCFLILLTMAIFAGTGMASPPDPIKAKQRLVNVLQREGHQGGVVAQARIEGIDYGQALNRAVDGNEGALGSLFAMKFVGEGGETHCANLRDLMIIWGDGPFSSVLAKQAAVVRGWVATGIDYAWAESDWTLFPKTRAIFIEETAGEPGGSRFR